MADEHWRGRVSDVEYLERINRAASLDDKSEAVFNPYVVGRDPVTAVRQVALADPGHYRVGYIEYLEGVGSAAPFSDVGVSALYEDAVRLRRQQLCPAPSYSG